MAGKKKSCFVIGPIGKPDSEIREWADTILECIIIPAVTSCDYDKPIRADQISESGMITFQIIEHLIKDDLVIADLTYANPNVYYELAVRHAVKKPFVQIIGENEDMPFDTKDLRTVKVSMNVRIAQQATKALKQYILEAEKQGSNIKTPISLVVDLELMKASGDKQQHTLAELLGVMTGMSANQREMVKTLMMIFGTLDAMEKKAESLPYQYSPPPSQQEIFRRFFEKHRPKEVSDSLDEIQ